MMTRSIVGRFLILAVLLVSLGVIAQAAIKITQASTKAVAKAEPAAPAPAPVQVAALAPPADPAPAAAAAAAMPQVADAAPVRVVYPGPLGDAPAPRKIVDAAPAAPLPAAPPQPAAPVPTPVPVALAAPLPAPAAAPAAKPTPVVVASAEADAQPTAPSKGGVNLNSASVADLNKLGGGHIGQAIVSHRPYRSVEDLVKKRIVRRSVYEQIKDQVAAD